MIMDDATNNPVVLEARDLRKTYRLGRVPVPVLKNAAIEIRDGEWVAILGASGSGKSTLLHLLGGLDRPDRGHGEIRHRGRRVSGLRGGALNTYRNRDVGFVFQFYHLLPELSVIENAMLPRLVPGGFVVAALPLLVAMIGAAIGAALGWTLGGAVLPEADVPTAAKFAVLAGTWAVVGAAAAVLIFQIVQAMAERHRIRHGEHATGVRRTLEEFGLGGRLQHRPSQLSGGERQRTAIARALAADPGILLADEPTGNLDAETGREILDLLQTRHRDGLTIVMVTHDPKVAAYADRIVRIEDGRVIEPEATSSETA